MTVCALMNRAYKLVQAQGQSFIQVAFEIEMRFSRSRFTIGPGNESKGKLRARKAAAFLTRVFRAKAHIFGQQGGVLIDLLRV